MNNMNNKNSIMEFEENFINYVQTYSITQDQQEEEGPIIEKATQIVQKYAMIEGIPFHFALIGICGLFQSGAYLKSVTNRKIKFSNKEFTKKSLLFAAEQVDNKYTLRKIAKALRYTIARVAYYYNIPGHLYSRYKIENANYIAQCSPDKIRELSTYCTDFQLENDHTPPEIREYLANREKNRSITNKKN